VYLLIQWTIGDYREQPLTYSRRTRNLLVMGTLSWGWGGWIRYEASDCPPTYLRYLPNERDRYLLRELVIDSAEDEPITAGVLARIPVTAIETLLNGDKEARAQLADSVNTKSSPVGGPATGSNIAILASRYVTLYGNAADPTEDWCVAAAYATAGIKPYANVKKRHQSGRQLSTDAEYRLTGPPGPEGLSDEFLDRVRRAYLAATRRREPSVSKALAADAQVSHRSVERWVYEARKRGVMPAARARGARG
jgi:hypothetical protein